MFKSKDRLAETCMLLAGGESPRALVIPIEASRVGVEAINKKQLFKSLLRS